MMFKGSEKYPNEEDLEQFLIASDAETKSEHTVFHVDIIGDYLEGALDRFSSLFISPLMLKDAMEMEMEAIEVQFQNNINSDSNRLTQLIASKAEGVASTFPLGNLKSLKKNVSKSKLHKSTHEFRKKYYVANNMNLCVESAESLDNLQNMVIKYFSDIPSGSQHSRPENDCNHFKREFFEKVLYVKPKSEELKLILTFVLPSMENHYRTKPHDYVAYLIQHEGLGSLNAYLKRK